VSILMIISNIYFVRENENRNVSRLNLTLYINNNLFYNFFKDMPNITQNQHLFYALATYFDELTLY
jgi:hypothetical protein